MDLEDTDKTIEVMKAAMKKENDMQNQKKESTDEKIDITVDNISDDKEVAAGNKDCSSEAAGGEFAKDEATDDDSFSVEEKTEGNDEAEGKPSKNGKGFFKNSKNKELAAKDQKIDELTDRLVRQMAEFDNFRKRTEKEKSQMYDIGVKSLIEKLLPIVDNFERGLGTITEKEKESAFAQGFELIYKQMMTALEEIGVKPIEAVGKEFDPAFHNAVMHGEDENLGENIISDEFQKGYMYRDIVVRHSMVKVVN